jgi:adenosylhomocysteine nucleosidase
VIDIYQPKEVVSVGFAGALESSGRVGDVSEPETVVDARDGSRIQTGHGIGVLVSFGSVAAQQQKQKLAAAFGAQIVDMEAAAVAKGAQAHGISFRAIKVISDELEFSMIPMDHFIDAAGNINRSRELPVQQ